MKLNLILILLLFSGKIFSQIPSQPKLEPVRIESLKNPPNDTFRIKDPVDPSREYLVVKNPKGVIMSRGVLVNSKKDGVWRDYSSAGDLMKVDEYKMGVKNGASVVLTVSGMVTQDMNFKNDTLDGQKNIFQPNGKFKSMENFSNGILNGPRKTFYDDGKPMEDSYYKNGLRDSICIWYMQNGKPSIEYNYKNGVLEGPSKEYDLEGRLKREGRYKNNNEEGEWKEYKDSVLVKKIVFKEGQVVKEINVKK